MADTDSPQDQTPETDRKPQETAPESKDAGWNIDMSPDDVLDRLFGKPKS